MKIQTKLMPLLFVLMSLISQDVFAGQSFFDLLKQVDDIKKDLDTIKGEDEEQDSARNATDPNSIIGILGGMACGSAVKNSTALMQVGAFMACGKAIEALSAQLTTPELAEVQASTEETFTTGEDRTWSNDAGIKVENKVVREEVRTATVPLAMGFIQADVSAKKHVIIYASPSKDSDLLAFVEPDDEIFVVGRLQSADWYVVESDDSITGFVQAESIQDEVSMQSVVSKYVARELTVIYQAPSQDSKLLAAVEKGEQVLVVGQIDSDEWYTVQSAGKKPAGYVRAASLKRSAASPQPSRQQKIAAAPVSSPRSAGSVQDASNAASEPQVAQKKSLPAAAKPAENKQAVQVAATQTQEVGLSMRCRTVERTATLSGGEVIVEEITACKTPNGWRQV